MEVAATAAGSAGTGGEADHGSATTPDKTGPRKKGALLSALTRRPRIAVTAGAAGAGVITAGIYDRHSWSWGDFPTWVLAAGAIVTSVFAILAFRKQSAELTILNSQADDQRDTNVKLTAAAELQAQELRESLDERKRQAGEQRRAQAESIDLTWSDLEAKPGNSLVVVINGSRRPIRSVTCVVYPQSSDQTLPPASWAEMLPAPVQIGGWTFPDTLTAGQPIVIAVRAGGRAGFRFPRSMQGLLEAEVQFNDDAGLRWALNNELHLRQP